MSLLESGDSIALYKSDQQQQHQQQQQQQKPPPSFLTSEVGLLELAQDHLQEVLALEAGVGFVGHEHGVAVDDLAVQHAGDDDGEEAAAHKYGAGVAEALGGVVVGVLGYLGYAGEVAHRQVAHHRHAGAPCTVS